VIHSNVSIGEGTYVHEGAIVGEAPRGKQPGELKTVIGAGGVIRSGTVIYAGTVIGDRFNSGHGALVREDNVIGDDCSVGTNAVLERRGIAQPCRFGVALLAGEAGEQAHALLGSQASVQVTHLAVDRLRHLSAAVATPRPAAARG